MGERTWKIISYLFHPLFMPTLGVTLIILSDPFIYASVDSGDLQKLLLACISLAIFCTVCLPLFFGWVLLSSGRINSMFKPDERDRKYLMALTELGFMITYYAICKAPSIGWSLKYFMLGVNISMIVTFITSVKTNVSLHAVGIGGMLGTVIGLMYYTHTMNYPLTAATIALVCLVDYARYKLKAHQAADIYIGNIIGIACQAAVFFYI